MAKTPRAPSRSPVDPVTANTAKAAARNTDSGPAHPAPPGAAPGDCLTAMFDPSTSMKTGALAAMSLSLRPVFWHRQGFNEKCSRRFFAWCRQLPGGR